MFLGKLKSILCVELLATAIGRDNVIIYLGISNVRKFCQYADAITRILNPQKRCSSALLDNFRSTFWPARKLLKKKHEVP